MCMRPCIVWNWDVQHNLGRLSSATQQKHHHCDMLMSIVNSRIRAVITVPRCMKSQEKEIDEHNATNMILFACAFFATKSPTHGILPSLFSHRLPEVRNFSSFLPLSSNKPSSPLANLNRSNYFRERRSSSLTHDYIYPLTSLERDIYLPLHDLIAHDLDI
jgi:hypothetical protein